MSKHIVELFNPANAANLKDADLKALPSLTKEDVAELAKAYPNTATNNNYLLLFDKKLPEDKQLYQLSSWQNLRDLWNVGQLQFVPFGFRGYQGPKRSEPVAPAQQAVASKVVDLSEHEAANAEGLQQEKKAPVNIVELSADQSEKLDDLKAELENLKQNGAHHMKIKSVEKQIAQIKGE